jgi:uncharacterized protein YndB with AHSA1/START domain
MPDIRHLIQIASDPKSVYQLVAFADGLKKWWAEDVFDESAERVSLGFFNRTTVYRLRAEEVNPHLTAIWRCQTGQEWEGTRLIFELIPRPAQTQLLFTHAGWKDETEYFRSCNTTWGELMFRIKSAAEGHGSNPLFTSGGLAY